MYAYLQFERILCWCRSFSCLTANAGSAAFGSNRNACYNVLILFHFSRAPFYLQLEESRHHPRVPAQPSQRCMMLPLSATPSWTRNAATAAATLP